MIWLSDDQHRPASAVGIRLRRRRRDSRRLARTPPIATAQDTYDAGGKIAVRTTGRRANTVTPAPKFPSIRQTALHNAKSLHP